MLLSSFRSIDCNHHHRKATNIASGHLRHSLTIHHSLCRPRDTSLHPASSSPSSERSYEHDTAIEQNTATLHATVVFRSTPTAAALISIAYLTYVIWSLATVVRLICYPTVPIPSSLRFVDRTSSIKVIMFDNLDLLLTISNI